MVAFCTTCKNRAQHIEITLPENLKNNRHEDTRFILLNYNSQDHLNEYLAAKHLPDIDSGRPVVYHFPEVGPFRMAHAKNMSHRLAMREGCSQLMNMDADNYTAPDFDLAIREAFATESPIFLWPNIASVKEKREKGGFKGLNGRIGVTQSAFLKAGGYDERFRTWSPDDKDFDARLRRLGYERVEIPEHHLQVVLHTDKMRFREYQHARETVEEYHQAIILSPDHTLVNQGRIGMGRVFRNFGEQPVILGPLPTRVFGIGWHKTATTSLHTALTKLGFDSAHWKTAKWAKNIWEEMNKFGKSLTLEKSYALCDMPIPILYQSLDIAYPGSKFILTIRDERDWLDSIRRHWEFDSNPFRHQWDDDPFTHRLHTILYGQKEFDAELFTHRYRRHNAEVLEYFANRPGDLLVMDMSAGDGWDKLCPFLGCAVPNEPYPRIFSQKVEGEKLWDKTWTAEELHKKKEYMSKIYDVDDESLESDFKGPRIPAKRLSIEEVEEKLPNPEMGLVGSEFVDFGLSGKLHKGSQSTIPAVLEPVPFDPESPDTAQAQNYYPRIEEVKAVRFNGGNYLTICEWLLPQAAASIFEISQSQDHGLLFIQKVGSVTADVVEVGDFILLGADGRVEVWDCESFCEAYDLGFTLKIKE